MPEQSNNSLSCRLNKTTRQSTNRLQISHHVLSWKYLISIHLQVPVCTLMLTRKTIFACVYALSLSISLPAACCLLFRIQREPNTTSPCSHTHTRSHERHKKACVIVIWCECPQWYPENGGFVLFYSSSDLLPLAAR